MCWLLLCYVAFKCILVGGTLVLHPNVSLQWQKLNWNWKLNFSCWCILECLKIFKILLNIHKNLRTSYPLKDARIARWCLCGESIKVIIKFLYRTVGRKGENTAIAAVSQIRRRTPRPRSWSCRWPTGTSPSGSCCKPSRWEPRASYTTPRWSW